MIKSFKINQEFIIVINYFKFVIKLGIFYFR